MKLRKDPYFIAAALFLCFPVGLYLAIRARIPKRMLYLFVSIAVLINLAFLLIAINPPSKQEVSKDFKVLISRDTLKVGESSSVTLIIENGVEPDFELIVENNCLSISDSVITAEKIGQCMLTIKRDQEIRTIPIVITSDEGGKETVYLTQNGEKYHKTKSHCRKNILTMTREEAVQSGKSPCKNCY